MKTTWKDKEIDPLQEYNAESHRITIESIQRALVQLLEQKDFRSITISQIVQRAGVSRSAFYRNYQSKEEVLQSIIYDSFSEMVKEIRRMTDQGSPVEWRNTIAQMAVRAADMYAIMSSDAWQGGTMLQCMNDYMTQMMPPSGGENESLYRFWMGGTYNLIQHWLDTGRKESPTELADQIIRCIRR